jgi:PIN domain nuclease of toxin-antitoxin system
VELWSRWSEIHASHPTPVILLDTNALIWLHRGHPRAAGLVQDGRRLYISPASLLELQFLIEAGRARLRAGGSVMHLANDQRWLLDDPPAAAWFETAIDVAWTRDPFDRVIVAHARLRKWRLATGDFGLIQHLAPHEYLEV